MTSELVCLEICGNGRDYNNDGSTDAEDDSCANHEPIARATAPGIVSEGENSYLERWAERRSRRG